METLKIVAVSDTHTMGLRIAVPDGDILIHAGDHTFRGIEGEVREALDWLASMPHKHKIFVAGNHDWYFDDYTDKTSFRTWSLKRETAVQDLLAEYPDLTYLEDEAATIEGIKFYGSPWTPEFCDWAFNFPRFDNGAFAKDTWAKIPEDTEVLITHGPPAGILDVARGDFGDNRTGCPHLRKRIAQLPNLALHIFGHIHEQYGTETHNGTTFVNAAVNTREYEPLNRPFVIEIGRKPEDAV
jgi:predicted phosphodiesterase